MATTTHWSRSSLNTSSQRRTSSMNDLCFMREYKRRRNEETVEEFVRDLQASVQRCDYQDPDDHVLDRLVCGLQHTTVKQKLQLIQDLTLERATAIARQHEQVRQQLAQQQAQLEVSEASAQRARPQRKSPPNRSKPKVNRKKPCEYCGYKKHTVEGKCPASGIHTTSAEEKDTSHGFVAQELSMVTNKSQTR